MPKWIRALPHQRTVLLAGLFATLNFLDLWLIPGGDLFRDGKIRYLFLCIAGLAFAYLRKHLTFAPAYFAALAIVSYAMNDFLFQGAMPLLLILGVMVAAVGVVKLGKERLSELLIWSGTFQAVFALLQFLFGLHFLFRPVNPEHLHIPVGLYGHETVLGPFLVACLAPALWGRRWVHAGLIGAAVVAGGSSMTLAALGAVLLLFTWHQAGLKWAGAVLFGGSTALALLYAINPDAGLLNFNGRWVIWKYGWEAFMANPLWGSGIGSWAGDWISKFAKQYATELRTFPRQLHSDPLDFLVEYGLMGAAPLAAAGGLFLRHFRPSWIHAVCVGLLVNSMANFPLCIAPIALVFVACWALSVRGVIMEECEKR